MKSRYPILGTFNFLRVEELNFKETQFIKIVLTLGITLLIPQANAYSNVPDVKLTPHEKFYPLNDWKVIPGSCVSPFDRRWDTAKTAKIPGRLGDQLVASVQAEFSNKSKLRSLGLVWDQVGAFKIDVNGLEYQIGKTGGRDIEFGYGLKVFPLPDSDHYIITVCAIYEIGATVGIWVAPRISYIENAEYDTWVKQIICNPHCKGIGCGLLMFFSQ